MLSKLVLFINKKICRVSGQFPDWHFPEDRIQIGTSPKDTFSAVETFPTKHFLTTAFPQLAISPTICFKISIYYAVKKSGN